MNRPPFFSADEYIHFGFGSRRIDQVQLHRAFHRHNEIELIFVEKGSVALLLGGKLVRWSVGQLHVFWGAIPHAAFENDPGTLLHRLTVPLTWFLGWQLPQSFTRAILAGASIVSPDGSETAADLALFSRWHQDLQDGSGERQKIVLLECEARMRRLALAVPVAESAPAGSRTARQHDLSKVEAMARYVALQYTEHIRIPDVARDVGLHPDYAATLFRKICGLSLVDYVNEHRISHAQRLLATTDSKIVDIAFLSGFGAASRFYSTFKKACGRTPKAYRVEMNESGPKPRLAFSPPPPLAALRRWRSRPPEPEAGTEAGSLNRGEKPQNER